MAKPILLTVDDDPDVLRAIERDLRRRYAATYRILRADSAEAALGALDQLRLRGESVALFLVDQRMPQLDGVGFLKQARALAPDAKRVLLTAYADTDAAIRAINDIRLDHYLLKPWDPPEERLYPVLDDLLEDWQAQHRGAAAGLRVIGHRWSAASHAIKDFLARNTIPYRWLDIESSTEAPALLQTAGVDTHKLPVVLFDDGQHLVQPSVTDVAGRIGLQQRPERPFYDLIIVGGGPAGLAAAVYGASEGLKTVLIESEAPGGQAGMSSRIENYLGFPVGLSGGDLARRAVAQARRFGVEILTPQTAAGLRVDDPYRIVTLGDGSEVSGHSVIVATGVAYRTLNVPGVERLTGAGVYYGAAMTEALACRDEDVYLVGGANSAGQAAMYFSQYARQVRMLVRGPSLTASMSQYLIDQIDQTPNIEVWTGSQVVEAQGETSLTGLRVRRGGQGHGQAETAEEVDVPATALFIFIGALPCTDWLAGVVERDERGFVCAGPDLLERGKPPRGWNVPRQPFLLETSVPGVFAVGDVRRGSVKRVASGVGEGSIAVSFVHQHLASV